MACTPHRVPFRAASRFLARTLAWLALFVHAALVAAPAAAETGASDSTPSRGERPRIGVVLGGGGARGGSHIGILRVLEEYRVPVDYLVGSSMGSVIGGLYASGMSPDEMLEEIGRIDWLDIFDDLPPRRQRSFRRKQEDLVDLFEREIGIGRRGLRIPSGLVAGQKLNFLLRELTLHTVDINDFDDLGVPFRAIATDLESGEMVAIGDGDLAEAIRASMAISGLFTPVDRGGRVLVDGGVVRLLPVDVARDLGADIVIAVDVSEPFAPLDPEDSMFDVAVRTLNLLMAYNVEEAKGWLDEDDLLLRPDPEGIETLDFAKLDEAEHRGRIVAEAVAERLRSLSVSEEEFARHLEKVRRPRSTSGPIVVDRIRVTGNERVRDEMILRRLRTEAGQPLDLELLRQDLTDVYAMGEFSHVDFHLERRGMEDGATETVLVIQADEGEHPPMSLRAGVRIEGDLGGSSGFMLNFLFRRSIIHRYRAEWRSFMSLGDFVELNTEFFQYLGDAERWFIAPNARLIVDETTSFLDPTEKVIIDGWAGWLRLDVGYEAGTDLQARAGVQIGRLKTDAGPAGIDRVDIGQWSMRAAFDRLDSASFPSTGGYSAVRVDLSRPGLGAAESYDRLDWIGLKPWTWGRNSLLGKGELGTDFGGGLPVYDRFRLGGPQRLSGLERNQLRGDKKALVNLLFYRSLVDLTGPVAKGIYGGVSAEAGAVLPSDTAWSLERLVPSMSVFVAADTVLGPFHFGWGWAEGGNETFYVTLGHLHRIGRHW